MSQLPSLLFLGGGQMAEALIRGVLDAELLARDRIMVTDIRPERREHLAREIGVRTEARNQDAVPFGQVLILAVKPQDVPQVLQEIGPAVGPEQLVVSIAAGVPLTSIESALAGPTPVIRVMPNTPCLVGAGMAVLALGAHASPNDEELVLRIFSAVGQAVTLPERALDAVTALSASGPAFLGMVVEALIDGGVRVGLPRDIATRLAVQTALGTARMLSEAGVHPAKLKEMVASPGGTAIAGVHMLERGGLRAALLDAVVAATARSAQLGRGTTDHRKPTKEDQARG